MSSLPSFPRKKKGREAEVFLTKKDKKKKDRFEDKDVTRSHPPNIDCPSGPHREFFKKKKYKVMSIHFRQQLPDEYIKIVFLCTPGCSGHAGCFPSYKFGILRLLYKKDNAQNLVRR